MRNKVTGIVAGCMVAVVGLTACGDYPAGSDPDSALTSEYRGLRYFPDMYESPALKSQEAREFIATDREGRPLYYEETNDLGVVTNRRMVVRQVPGYLDPPPGAVPRNIDTFSIDADGLDTAARLANPLLPTREVLERGRDHYESFCAVCHGSDGNAANANMAAVISNVPSLRANLYWSPELRAQYGIDDPDAGMTDGHIMHVITWGIRRMPNYRAQLSVEDRWAVILYVRAMQEAWAMDPDLTDEERAALFASGEAFQPLPEPIPEYELGPDGQPLPPDDDDVSEDEVIGEGEGEDADADADDEAADSEAADSEAASTEPETTEPETTEPETTEPETTEPETTEPARPDPGISKSLDWKSGQHQEQP